jgi:hypothetical protein
MEAVSQEQVARMTLLQRGPWCESPECAEDLVGRFLRAEDRRYDACALRKPSGLRQVVLVE